MTRSIRILAGIGLGASLLSASASYAEEQTDRPIPEARQARLLERFGEQGIDANRDGTLTRDEVRTFFAENRPMGKCDESGPAFGRRAGRRGGPGHNGPRGADRGPGGRLGMMIHHLELLAGDAPPQFNLTNHPEADTDGDGTLSGAEWTAFSAQERQRILHRMAENVPLADANGDGTISDTELAAVKAWVTVRVLERHPEADTNGDGVLSEEELGALHQQRLEHRRGNVLENHPEADLDGNGALSDEEFHAFFATKGGWPRARMLDHHPEADLDGDGALSAEEADAFRADCPKQGCNKAGGCGMHRGPGRGGCGGGAPK